jgi:hypothetical protein
LPFSYSGQSYAFKLDSDTKQMFFASVCLGDVTHIMPNDNKLRKPPTRGKNSDGINEDYDTVSGETENSLVYMVYENGRAYPEYLITFS